MKIDSNYIEYLKKFFGVRGFDFEDKAPNVPGVEICLQYINLLKILPSSKLLEVGCGLGRVLREIYSTKIDLYGIDLHQDIIDAARERVQPYVKELKVSPAEDIDFENSFFNYLICWGVFDLTKQSISLKEFSRILKLNGKLLLSGKADNYEIDDQEAYLAEKACIQKKIPNHFTNFDLLIIYLPTLGFKVDEVRFFKRRGDLANNIFSTEMPDSFYEYVLILSKEKEVDYSTVKLMTIENKNSYTSTIIERKAA